MTTGGDNIWTTIAAERGALADDLSHLTPAQWDTPSMCSGWTVRDIVAHLSASIALTPTKFLVGMTKARFNIHRFRNDRIAKHRGADPVQTLEEFRGLQNSISASPGAKIPLLGEVVIHGDDVRRPLGISHTYRRDAVRYVIDFYKDRNIFIGAKDRIAGLALEATDHDWQHGKGEAVEGPLLSLLLAMTGRIPACDDLVGPGVNTLRSRCL
jgi:uncharacterized protein (TIGR03083 family)